MIKDIVAYVVIYGLGGVALLLVVNWVTPCGTCALKRGVKE